MQLNSRTVKQLRADRNWTQQHVDDACGLSLRTIQRVEKEGVASKEIIMSLCAVFEVSQSELINLPKVEDTTLNDGTGNQFIFVKFILERVDLCSIDSVQVQSILIAASLCRSSGLNQEVTTKSKLLWLEPFRQRLFGIFTALSLINVESLHGNHDALLKYQANCCRNLQQRSTRSNWFTRSCNWCK